MSDPKRWLASGGNATQLERELLANEIDAAPAAKLEEAIWTRVLGALPPVGGSPPDNGGSGGDWGSSSGGASAAGSAGVTGAGAGGAGVAGAGAGGVLVGAAKASGLGVTKAVVLGMFAGAVTVTGAAELGERVHLGAASVEVPAEAATEPAFEPPRPRLRSAPTTVADFPAEPAAAPKRVAARGDGARLRPAATGSALARFELPGASDLASRTRAERLALEQARRAFRNGDPRAALAIVDRAPEPASVLAQEREVLAIEALSAAGQSAQAKTRARAFLARFPGSPHQNHIGQFAR